MGGPLEAWRTEGRDAAKANGPTAPHSWELAVAPCSGQELHPPWPPSDLGWRAEAGPLWASLSDRQKAMASNMEQTTWGLATSCHVT